MANRINLDIAALAYGEVKERIDIEMDKIADNILDMNTDPTKERKLVIEVGFTPDKSRSTVSTAIQVTSKLSKQDKAVTTMLIGRDHNTGFIEMNELKSGTPGQMYFDPEDSKLKDDTGMEVEEIEVNGTIIDYNKRKEN